MERVATVAVPCEIRDLALADSGRRRIEWASLTMPVLRTIRKHLIRVQPFAGMKIVAGLHVTAETANLLITLRDGGASPVLCASSPQSTQDDVAAALVRDFGIPVFAIRGAGAADCALHHSAALGTGPQFVFDSGGHLASLLHDKGQDRLPVLGGIEETSSGVNRLRSLARTSSLAFPVIAAYDAPVKTLLDNRYGTGQSTMDSIVRATDLLIAGMTVVIAGYGSSGRGVASRARGLGANVIVTETDPAHAVQALMNGYRVMPMSEAATLGDIFITVTGSRNVLTRDTFERLKDGAILCNAGHSNVEIDLGALSRAAVAKRQAREFVEEFKLKDGRRICLLAEGRIVNLAVAEGHPASVMDVSFAIQALAAEFLVKNHATLDKTIHPVPDTIDKQVARMKLDSMGVAIDKLTIEQEQYLASWSEGT